MFINVKKLSPVMLISLVLGCVSTSFGQEPLKVVASFSVLGDIVEQIGGDAVSVSVLVGIDSDAHVYRAKPADAKKVQQAQVLVVNGLGFEGWMTRLEQSSDFQGVKVVATDNITLLHGHEEDHVVSNDENHAENHANDSDHSDHDHDSPGGFDPHAWHSIENVIVYIQNITAGLISASPDQKAVFTNRAEQYIAVLLELDRELGDLVASVPESQRVVITSHDAFAYLGKAYGFRFYSPQGVSTESEPSAKDVALLIRQIREQQVKAVFIENVTDARLIRQIAAETEARVGGTLYSGALSSKEGPAASYIDMMRHNVITLVAALK